MKYDAESIAELDCSSPITWTNDIKQLFTATDITCMKPRGIDLSDYEDVKLNAPQIYTQVASGAMPKGGTRWVDEWVNKFGCWIQQGYVQ